MNYNAIVNGRFVDQALYKNATFFFGSWDNTLRAAGVNPIEIRAEVHRKLRRYPDPAATRAAIRRRQRKRWPLNFIAITNGKHRDVALLMSAHRYFGSWDNALRAAGFDPSEVRAEARRKLRRYPNPAAVLAAIRKRQRDGRPLNHAGAVKGKFGDIGLYVEAKRHFGSWDNALRAAGSNPAEVRAEMFLKFQRYPDPAAVIAALQHRQTKGRPLNHAGAVKGRFRDTALYLAVKRHFGSWNNALRAAGFDPAAVHHDVWRRLRRYPDQASVLATLQQRQRDGRPLNSTCLEEGPFADSALYHEAKRHFSSWDNALRAAGIDPASVRLRK